MMDEFWITIVKGVKDVFGLSVVKPLKYLFFFFELIEGNFHSLSNSLNLIGLNNQIRKPGLTIASPSTKICVLGYLVSSIHSNTDNQSAY